MKLNCSEVVCKDPGLQPDKMKAKMYLVQIGNEENFKKFQWAGSL